MAKTYYTEVTPWFLGEMEPKIKSNTIGTQMSTNVSSMDTNNRLKLLAQGNKYKFQ